MHPVTPALKGWKVLVAVLAIGWFQVGENIEQAIDLLHGRGVPRCSSAASC